MPDFINVNEGNNAITAPTLKSVPIFGGGVFSQEFSQFNPKPQGESKGLAMLEAAAIDPRLIFKQKPEVLPQTQPNVPNFIKPLIKTVT